MCCEEVRTDGRLWVYNLLSALFFVSMRRFLQVERAIERHLRAKGRKFNSIFIRVARRGLFSVCFAMRKHFPADEVSLCITDGGIKTFCWS